MGTHIGLCWHCSWQKKIYVLHAFLKKSKSGIKTPQKDIDLIKRRYKKAQELASNEKKKNED